MRQREAIIKVMEKNGDKLICSRLESMYMKQGFEYAIGICESERGLIENLYWDSPGLFEGISDDAFREKVLRYLYDNRDKYRLFYDTEYITDISISDKQVTFKTELIKFETKLNIQEFAELFSIETNQIVEFV